jgi:hypothetical protein
MYYAPTEVISAPRRCDQHLLDTASPLLEATKQRSLDMMPHQAKSWHSCQLQLTYFSFALAIVAVLTACVGERNEFTVPAPAGGVAPVAQPQGGATQVVKPQQPLAPPIHPMLQDPEAESHEWTHNFKANSLSDAEQICQKMANNSGLTTLLKTTQRTKTPDKFGKVKFTCWFKSEITGGAYGDDRNRTGN